VFFTIIGHEKCELIGQHVKPLLLREHAGRNQVGKQTQVHTQLAGIRHLATHTQSVLYTVSPVDKSHHQVVMTGDIILPAKVREYVFTGVGLCVCL